MKKLIKILKDTPFDIAGAELSIVNFRAKYGWICTNSTTDEELIKYLEGEWKLNQPRPHQKHIGDWFEVVSYCCETRVYVIRNANNLDHHHSMLKDVEFISIAEGRGTVFSLLGFQEQFNSAQMQLDSETDVIRFLTIKNL